MNQVEFLPEHFEVTTDNYKLLREMNTIRDNVIVRLIEHEPVSAGGILLAQKDVEKSTVGVVLKPNKVSYHRNGDPCNPTLQFGDVVRLQRGNVGTTMPEAPEGQKWICVPEDCIYYSRTIKVED